MGTNGKAYFGSPHLNEMGDGTLHANKTSTDFASGLKPKNCTASQNSDNKFLKMTSKSADKSFGGGSNSKQPADFRIRTQGKRVSEV